MSYKGNSQISTTQGFGKNLYFEDESIGSGTPPPPDRFLLLEDGGFLLQEDGGQILLET